MTRWHRDRESGMTHGYRRSAEVAACGKALRIEARDEPSSTRLGRCALCVRWLAGDDAKERER